jgi:NAD(P)H-flavin reductase
VKSPDEEMHTVFVPANTASVPATEIDTDCVAVLQVMPTYRLPKRPGQSVAVECHLRPRLWRFLSPANAPRPDGRVDLHVRHVPGGQVSAALVQAVRVGDTLRLGAAVGQRLTLAPGTERDLLLIAGGTGLAPLKAIVEQVAADGGRRRVHLFMGARTERDLYDLKAMSELAEEWAGLTVVPTVSDDAYAAQIEHGSAVEVALRHGAWPDHEVIVCGSEEMVAGSVTTLTQRGVRPDRIRFESFQRPGTPAYPGGRSNAAERGEAVAGTGRTAASRPSSSARRPLPDVEPGGFSELSHQPAPPRRRVGLETGWRAPGREQAHQSGVA